MLKNRRFRRRAAVVIAVAAAAGVVFSLDVSGVEGDATDPRSAPMPALEDLRAQLSVVVTLRFADLAPVKVESVKVVSAAPYARVDGAPFLRFKVFDDAGNVVEEFVAAHPRLLGIYNPDGSHAHRLAPETVRSYAVAFAENLESLVVIDEQAGRQVVDIDLRKTVSRHCQFHPESCEQSPE